MLKSMLLKNGKKIFGAKISQKCKKRVITIFRGEVALELKIVSWFYQKHKKIFLDGEKIGVGFQQNYFSKLPLDVVRAT